jgi:hypothetical protein
MRGAARRHVTADASRLAEGQRYMYSWWSSMLVLSVWRHYTSKCTRAMMQIQLTLAVAAAAVVATAAALRGSPAEGGTPLPYWDTIALNTKLPHGGAQLINGTRWTRLYFAVPKIGTYAMR